MDYSCQIGISKNIKPNMLDYDNCTGCMACLNVCPKNAISCVENENGFIVPLVNKDLCINCGLCEKTCVLNNEIDSGPVIKKTIALVHDDKNVLQKSTSGGAFTALSDVILKKNGVIVGAYMDETFSVCHILTSEPSVRDKMRGSKYVQSNVGFSFREIKKLLEAGSYVLFVGTPCQTHALRQYLKKDYDSLYVVDLLCHGVPSNKMFKEHISYIHSLEKSNISEYRFRTKRFGRRNSIQEYKLENSNKFITSIDAQEYASFFRQSLSLRQSCRSCRYRCSHRFGDVTIGDYWGKTEPLKNGKRGVSLICINTPKGQELIDSIENVDYINLNTEAIIKRPEFTSPRPKDQNYIDKYWSDYRELGYLKIVEKYYHVSFSRRLRFQIKNIIAKMTR